MVDAAKDRAVAALHRMAEQSRGWAAAEDFRRFARAELRKLTGGKTPRTGRGQGTAPEGAQN